MAKIRQCTHCYPELKIGKKPLPTPAFLRTHAGLLEEYAQVMNSDYPKHAKMIRLVAMSLKRRAEMIESGKVPQ